MCVKQVAAVQEHACSVNLPCINKIHKINKIVLILSYNLFKTLSCTTLILTCFMFFLLAGPFANSQVHRCLFGWDGEFVDVLPPLSLEVFVFLLLPFLFLLELHLLNRHSKARTSACDQPIFT